MNRHERTEPINDNQPGNQLSVIVTSECFSRSILTSIGWPRLVIDYGGAALVLDIDDPRQAETFALGLARSSLDFASRCRYLIGGPYE